MFVLVCHFGQTTGWPVMTAPDIKNIAVDFFFCLSGFVMCWAYDGRLRAGLGVGAFMWARVLRLYPIYLLGLGAGLVSLAPLLLHADAFAQAAPVVAANVFLVPWPLAHTVELLHKPQFLFPFNPSSWSLLFELMVNAPFAALVFRLGRGGLTVVAALTGAAFAAALLYFGSDEMGWSPATAIGGLARAAFGFSMGWLLGRLFDARTRRVRPAAALACFAAFLVAVSVVAPAPLRAAYEIGAVLLGAPAIVWWGAWAELPPSARRVAAWGGDISYPLYMLHIPLMETLMRLNRWTLHLPPPALLVAVVAVSLAASQLALVAFDAPVRGWIVRRLKARRAPLAQLA